jgi:hypothetical protein
VVERRSMIGIGLSLAHAGHVSACNASELCACRNAASNPS